MEEISSLTLFFMCVGWYLIGVISALYLFYTIKIFKKNITVSDLIVSILIGAFGPLNIIVAILLFIADSSFLDKQIWPRE